MSYTLRLLVFPTTLTLSLAGWVCAEILVSARGGLSKIVSEATPKGWELYEEVLQFSPENLYEQINGRAELFLSYNVVSLTYATFDKKDEPGLSIYLSIYEMDSVLNAFGVFSVERTVGAPEIQLGREAYQSGANLYLWKGQYYVKAISSDSGRLARDAALGIVQEVAQQLRDAGEEIWASRVFPSEGLVRDSLKYFLVDAMGLDFMQNTFTAHYRMDGSEIRAFISRRASEAGVLSALQGYTGFAERYGRGVERTPRRGAELLVCEMKEGYDVVTTKGIYLLGVTAVPELALAIEAAEKLLSQCCSRP
jgi:hypothetical protein